MPEVLPSVHLIDLCFQDRRAALAAYLLVGPDGQAALIETGPTTTRAALLDGVRAAGVDPAGIADVLVTHIHLDHAGGAGALLRDDLPAAPVRMHPAGRPHLVNPGKLLRSAARLYGERMEELWGEVTPLPAERVAALEDGARLRLAGHDLEVLFTPGHATHHVAVPHLASGAVFTGDVAGVRVPGAGVIHPPTVPPEFDPAAWERHIARETGAAYAAACRLLTADSCPLSFVQRRVRHVAGADVLGTRTDQAVVPVLLQHVRGPARHAADGEDGREQVGRDAEVVVGRGRVEVDVGVEAFVGLDRLLHLPRYLVPLRLAALLAQLLGQAAQVRGARVLGPVDAMAEAHDLRAGRQL